MTKVFRLTLH